MNYRTYTFQPDRVGKLDLSHGSTYELMNLAAEEIAASGATSSILSRIQGAKRQQTGSTVASRSRH